MFAASCGLSAIYQPHDDLVGAIQKYKAGPNDNLYEIARKFDVGIVSILVANDIADPWEIEEGKLIVIPTMHILPSTRHEGIVINLAELRLYYYADSGEVMVFPVGIGKDGWQTRQGVTSVVRKQQDPPWIPPDSIRAENPSLPEIILAGPENPLGQYALYLGWPSYLIHGTNRPHGVGKRSSHGCVRLYPEDIERLFAETDIGTKVTVIDIPYKLGWRSDELWFEVNPTQEQSDDIADYNKPFSESHPEVYSFIAQAAGDGANINWYAIEEAIANHNGIPVIIAEKSRKWQK